MRLAYSRNRFAAGRKGGLLYNPSLETIRSGFVEKRARKINLYDVVWFGYLGEIKVGVMKASTNAAAISNGMMTVKK
jgi:hypothetical protein